jgi:hypothetical protein
MSNLKKLREILKEHPPGPISDNIFNLLYYAWEEEVTGWQNTNLFANKLHRAESPEWDPPYISFMIERHGSMSGGSKRAQVYKWRVNIENGKAEGGLAGSRQICPIDKRLDTKAIAVELCSIIEKKTLDSRIIYRNEEKTEFKLVISEIITADSKQTLASRRKRFRSQFNEQLKEMGWEEVGRYIYQKTSS